MCYLAHNMPPLAILTFPNPKLREKSKEINKKEISKLEPLIFDMIETMAAADGVGLAAPQIGQNIRLVVINKEVAGTKTDTAFINPQIVKHSWRRVKDSEGCLSVPGVIKEVTRYKKIGIKALDQNGQPLNFSAADLFARVIQHEIDHLDGVLIVDK